MQKCKICDSTDFYKEAGYFFCQICQTQNEVLQFFFFSKTIYQVIRLFLQDIREEILELHIDNSTRLRKTKIRQLKSNKSGLF